MLLLVEIDGVTGLIKELGTGLGGDGVRLCSIVTVCFVVGILSTAVSRMMIEEKNKKKTSFFTFICFNLHFNTST